MRVVAEAQRRCIVCRRSLPKREMLRLVIDDALKVWPDLAQNAPGRGAYLCMQEACIRRLNDKHLRAAWKKPLPAQKEELLGKIQQALQHALHLMLTRLRPISALGRRAVLAQLEREQAMIVFFTADAGEGLRSSIQRAIQCKPSIDVTIADMPRDLPVAHALGRRKIGVWSLVDTPLARKTLHLNRWLGCLEKSR